MGQCVFAVTLGVVAALAGGCTPEKESQQIEPPQAISDSMPFKYPLQLWDHKISGQTILLMRISELGNVDSVVVATSSGYAEFDTAAVRGARDIKWAAGKQGERRVAMWTKLPVRFARDTAKRMGLGGE